MSEDVQHSRPRGWKAFQVNYDDVFARSNRLCTVCLTEQQIAALLSMTEYLYWPTRWVRTDDDISADVVRSFTEKLERNLIMACCDDNLPIQYRYTPGGVLQRSLNAGGNWTDAPEYDPRVYSPQFPPMSGDDGDDKKCIAATGAAALIKEQVGEQLTDDMTRYTLSQLVTDWSKTYLETSNPFQSLLTVVANQIFALVIATLRPALTDGVYDTLQCILYCNMGEDATINNAQWSQIRSDITDQIGGIAGIFLEHLIYLLGTGGTTNLVRAGGAATGDCSDCPDCDACIVRAYVAPGVGTEISWEDCILTASSALDGGNHVIYVWFNNDTDTFDPDACTGYINFNVITPGVSVSIGYNDCGTATQHFPALLPTTPISQFFLFAAAEFTAEFITTAP